MSAMVLVTGGGGRLAQAIRAKGQDAVTAPARRELDITDAASIADAMTRHSPQIVINAAGHTRVDLAESDPAAAAHANVHGARLVAEACAQRGVPLIHVSTDYVFGDGDRPWREDDALAPLNLYGRTKADGEAAVRGAGGRHVIARVAWLFAHEGDFLERMLDKAATSETVRAVEDQVGSPTPLDVLAARLLRLADLMASGATTPEVLHVAGSPATSRLGWCAVAMDAARAAGGRLGRLEPARAADFATPARRPSFSALDTTRADALLGPIDWQSAAAAIGRAWAKRQMAR